MFFTQREVIFLDRMRTRKSWREKLADNKGLPRVEKITPKMSSRWGSGTVVIPAPMEVDALMKRIPFGKVTTINELRSALAARHHASIGCPITTGIFAWIAAHAAEEAAAAGRKRITPYWRTLKSGGQLNPKYPGGLAALRGRLQAEGHKIVKRGSNYYVADFEKALIHILPK
jgi:hypothetical protein